MQAIRGYLDRRVTANGLDFHYLEWGNTSAPPMVLLHGLTGHAHIWDHVAPELATRYHLYCVDQRGHGDTQHATTYRTSDFVDDLHALTLEWGLDRFVLMGLSMGGHNSMAYAAAHPDRIERLIVIDIPPKFDMSTTPNWQHQLRIAREGHAGFADFEAAFRDARAGNATAPEENLRYRTEWNTRTLDDGRLTLVWDPKAPTSWQIDDLTPRLGHIASPTLLVIGGKSLLMSRARAESMLAGFPDATLAEVAESGHSVPTDCPEELARVVVNWLDERA